MLGTKLCHDCWEITSRAKGFVVFNATSNGFCYFRHLTPALLFYRDGLKRGETYMLLIVLHGKVPV